MNSALTTTGFKRITSLSELPPLSSPETDALDWKRQVDSGKRQELAKDMAAMANASGGNIVIGVKEGSAHVSAALHPLSRIQAQTLAIAYEHAARDLVSPPLKVDTCLIPLEDNDSDKWILAVNIHPTDAIFCAIKITNEIPGQSRESAWQIPKRVASQTKYLTPADAQLATVERLRSATQRTLSLIEDWQADLSRREKVRRFEDFMANESHHDVRFPELASEDNPMGLEYTIRPVRDAQGTPMHDKGEMRSRWVVEVVGPAHESVMKPERLKSYECSPIRDGDYYYCEFYNDSWHMSDGWMVSKEYSFYLSGKVGPGEHLESANLFVKRHRAQDAERLTELFDVVLDLQGKRLKGGGSGNRFSVFKDELSRLFLRIEDSPPKRIYFTNPVNTWGDTGWYFEIEKLRGHGGPEVETNIRNSIRAELERRDIPIPKTPWYETPRANHG